MVHMHPIADVPGVGEVEVDRVGEVEVDRVGEVGEEVRVRGVVGFPRVLILWVRRGGELLGEWG
ncbi:hypothetical protein PMIN02_003689 [Paraphaeosphaeria minitans]